MLRPVSRPLSPAGNHIIVLQGNLARQSAVMKLSGKEIDLFEGPAVVFDGEMAAFEAIGRNRVSAGMVVVIRYEGPKGAPGMPEMLSPGAALVGQGLGKKVASRSPSRVAWGRAVVGHGRGPRPLGTALCHRSSQVALVTDGRFSGASHGIMIGHVTPEASDGGVIAIVRDGDPIRIDKRTQTIDLMLPEAEIEGRLIQPLGPPHSRPPHGLQRRTPAT